MSGSTDALQKLRDMAYSGGPMAYPSAPAAPAYGKGVPAKPAPRD